ncbi:MAG: MAPEG family protein [Alphaproteobacteria bacterium]|nr:MAG: MAPEG family protein [Alphaproteobacteria bacterium]
MTIAAWCLVIAFVLIYVPRGAAIRGAIRQDGDYDIINPRAQQARLEGRAACAQAAHLNMVEAFGPFAAAVLLDHVLGADAFWRDALAVIFIVARVLYIPAYTRGWGYGRTAIWAIGLLATLGLFLLPAFAHS